MEGVGAILDRMVRESLSDKEHFEQTPKSREGGKCEYLGEEHFRHQEPHGQGL